MAFLHLSGELHTTRDGLARLFGVTPRTISNWSSEPTFPQAVADPNDRRRRFYPVAAVVQWVRERDRQSLMADATGDAEGGPLRLEVERALLAREQRRKLEVERRKLEGELVEVAEVRQWVASMIATARTRLLGVPSKAKQRIPHLERTDVFEFEELIREALEGLADEGTKIAAGAEGSAD